MAPESGRREARCAFAGGIRRPESGHRWGPLRGAQAELIEAPVPAASGWASVARRLLRRPALADEELDASHPYYWAAFQVFRFAPTMREKGAPAGSVLSGAR